MSNNQYTMAYDINWIYPTLRRPYKIWNIATSITIAAVGLFSKIIIEWLNTTNVYNKDILMTALDRRPKDIPLITVSNHHSCFDDPGLWGILNVGTLFNRDRMRWSLAAHDICFTNAIHSYFFGLGKCVPIIRGAGVYQQAIDFCIELLDRGNWVHIFPEGKVNMTKELLRFKWGVGRMVYESAVSPIIVPMWHIGMDDILPNDPPYLLRTRNRITINFGRPINIADTVERLRKNCVSPQEARKVITDRIQEEMMTLKAETEKLHQIMLRAGK